MRTFLKGVKRPGGKTVEVEAGTTIRVPLSWNDQDLFNRTEIPYGISAYTMRRGEQLLGFSLETYDDWSADGAVQFTLGTELLGPNQGNIFSVSVAEEDLAYLLPVDPAPLFAMNASPSSPLGLYLYARGDVPLRIGSTAENPSSGRGTAIIVIGR